MVTMSVECKRTNPYRGRFAPSPTGSLHFGSLVAAVGSFLQARSQNGRWLVRIEDIDPPREIPGAAGDQLDTLKRFGLISDEPVEFQSRNRPRYHKALADLLDRRQAFYCGCTRRDLEPSGRYPGTCRDGVPPGRQPRSIRVRVDNQPIRFRDLCQGQNEYRLAESCGDFVIRRADGLTAYQLAVVVDDAAAGITEVVRGADLLDSTPRQIHLYRCLGLTEPDWFHLPLVLDAKGQKLSKSGSADPVTRYRPAEALRLALAVLGHRPPRGVRSLEALWSWAQVNWNPSRVPSRSTSLDSI